ncbi:unnamed protein product [Menidia menidia]|uniref:(Atlantic silverside) hypothetical protein n=1 Tax=Menidia menidia TaxID=238744 RepID=A0A8S4BRJ5_9TELE|nr:unnamed protein product [Menidia menidia]
MKTGVAGGILQPSAGTSVGGAGVPAPSGVGTPGQPQTGVGVKAPKPFVPGPVAGGYPYGYGIPYQGAGTGTGPGAGTLPGAKPLKPPVAGGGAGIPLSAGGYQGGYNPYQQGYGQVGPGAAGGGAKAPKPGYGNLGTGGVYQQGVPPGYRGYPQQFYPGAYGPAGLTPQQAKAAKYGPLQGFLGGAGGGGGGGDVYRGGVAGCQGKYCGRRK